MANTLNLGTDGNWATKEDSLLAYNSENGNFKPLPFDFTRASSATVVNKAGLIETVGSGEPRIDFSNDAKGALLLEPTRTNNLLQSNQFDTTWSASNASTTSGQIGVGGSLDAWKLESSGSSSSFIFQAISTSAVTTRSIYAKAGSVNWFSINSGGSQVAYFDLSNGVVGTKSSNIIDATMESVGDGWYRCSVEIDSQSNFYVFIANADNSQSSNNGDSIYIQYAQLEQGSYATSYIPTQGSAVTRSADACNNAGNEQVINSTEGVLYLEGKVKSDSNSSINSIGISNGTDSNRLSIIMYGNSDLIRANMNVSSVSQFDFLQYGNNPEQYYKIAVSYKQNNCKIFINGVKVGVDISATMPSLGTFDTLNLDIGNNLYDFYGNIKDVKLYNTALTDSELQALTK